MRLSAASYRKLFVGDLLGRGQPNDKSIVLLWRIKKSCQLVNGNMEPFPAPRGNAKSTNFWSCFSVHVFSEGFDH